MKILIPIKRVLDYNLKPRVKSDGSGVDLSNAKMAMNPFDEIAVEQAIQTKEAGQAEDLALVSIGSAKAAETLRAGLAMGADRAIHIQTPDHAEPEPLAVAKLLYALCRREQPNLILMGKQAIDDDCGQTGQMLAALLGAPQATYASAITLNSDASQAEVVREIDGGLETINVNLPAVITVDLRLNEPRYASLPNIMKAKRKPLETITPEDLGVDVAPRLTTLSVAEPPARQAGVKVESVDDLVSRLKDEAGAL